MMLWPAVAVMTLAAVLPVIWPLLRRGPREIPPARAEHDLEIYRDQLTELDRERDSGRIDGEQESAARVEIGRRMLRAADETGAGAGADGGSRKTGRVVAAVLAGILPLAALLLYLNEGAPHLPGKPASETAGIRGEAAARQRQASQLVEELRKRVAKNPDDSRGWRALGRAEARLGRFQDAAGAYAKALKLNPTDADLWSRHGEAMTFASDGTVPPRAVESFAAALLAEPGEPRARFYLGVAELQAGKRQRALAWWLSLEAESQPDSPWMGTLTARINRLAVTLKLDPAALRARPPATPAPPAAGKAGTAVKKAQAAQNTMIRSMVARLAKRMEDNPDDAQGWLRLGRSYRVLGEIVKSRAAFGHAAALKPDDPAVLSRYAGAILRGLQPGQPPPPEFHAAIKAALKADPGFPNALWLAGMVADRRGKFKEAVAYWRRLVGQLKPGSPEYTQILKRIEVLEAQK